DDLLAQLAEVRRTGIAFDREEHTTGIAAIGSVVGDGLGTLAAVTIPMPAQRFYGNEERLAGILRPACEEMTRIIGTQTRGRPLRPRRAQPRAEARKRAPSMAPSPGRRG